MSQNFTYPYSINYKKNTLWNITSISHCNDESVEPTGSTEAIFDIIGMSSTVQS